METSSLDSRRMGGISENEEGVEAVICLCSSSDIEVGGLVIGITDAEAMMSVDFWYSSLCLFVFRLELRRTHGRRVKEGRRQSPEVD